MADSTSETLSLPSFESGKTYLLMGETLQQICDVIKENRVVPTGETQFDEIGPEGSKINLDGLSCDEGFTCVPDAPTEGTWVLGVIDGVLQWFETDTCS